MRLRKQVTVNIEELDKQIGTLIEELEIVEDDEEFEKITKKLEALTNLRCKSAESRMVNGSVKNVVVSGVLGLVSLGIVLKYEEKEVIVSKAFNMLPTMFKGS